MTTIVNPLYRSLELESIKQDVDFYYDVMLKLSSKRTIGVLIFGLMPYLSLFTVETYNYFQANFPQNAKSILREHEEIITSSRMRV